MHPLSIMMDDDFLRTDASYSATYKWPVRGERERPILGECLLQVRSLSHQPTPKYFRSHKIFTR
jgi:hypothetical protein